MVLDGSSRRAKHLTAYQSQRMIDRTNLREEHAVYLLRSGRMCIAGLNQRNVPAVVEAIADVVASKR